MHSYSCSFLTVLFWSFLAPGFQVQPKSHPLFWKCQILMISMATNLLQMGQHMSDALQLFLLMMAPDHKVLTYLLAGTPRGHTHPPKHWKCIPYWCRSLPKMTSNTQNNTIKQKLYISIITTSPKNGCHWDKISSLRTYKNW